MPGGCWLARRLHQLKASTTMDLSVSISLVLVRCVALRNLDLLIKTGWSVICPLKKNNQSTPRPSEHPPVMGEKMSKRLGGIKGCKYKTSLWHSNRFPDADNIGSTYNVVVIENAGRE